MITSPPRPVIEPLPANLEGNIQGFLSQFIHLAGQFWNSEQKDSIRLRTLALVALTVLQVGIAVAVTEWSSGLFNALEQHSITKLWTQVWLVLVILVANMAVTVTHLKVKRSLTLDWRGWLTDRLIGQWMDDGHHYQITYMPGKHDNPDGRIAEDIRIATEYAIDLSHSLFYSLVLLFSFSQILWSLSGTLRIPLGLFELPVPGYLVWLAFIYAAGASYLGWLIGRPLTLATDTRQTEEANFRFGLVRARENSEAIALVHGENDERRRFNSLFQQIVEAWNKQTKALADIMMFTSGYSVLSMAFPILAASPRYIIGTISLGALVQSAQAFQQVAAALSFPVDNLAKMAEWRASVERVLGLAHALGDLEEDITHPDPNTIVVEETQQPALVFHVLSIADPDGTVVLDGFEEQIQPGERVFLSGDHSVGVKLFKVIARLWPWGRGRVELPEGNRMFFMPPRPYLPIETLQRAVTYPALPDAFDISTVEHALRVSGLEELIDNLQDSKSWENVLSREQQQRLGVARLLLHRPRWILFQEALDSLAAEEAKTLLQMIFNELPDSAMLTLTNRSGIETLHHRQIQIHCPSCASPLKKATRQRREQNRRNQGEVSPVDQLIGSLRKDRRKS